MNTKVLETRSRFIRALMAFLCIMAVSTVQAKKELPKTSHDGLQLIEHTKMRAVYMKPGATLDQYKRIALLDCYVSFRKNWQREYNEDVVGLEGRINDADMQKIKKSVAAEFRKIFTEELETKGGYEIVNDAANDVLVLRPAIINLDVTAPDKMTPGMSMTFVASTGEMTLYLELYDSVTSDIIARIIDPEEARSMGGAGFSNRATNTRDEDRILRRWADLLRSHLGHVTGNTDD